MNIYKLKLGESAKVGPWDAFCVPGGWIFALETENGIASQFVPFNNEYANSYSDDNTPQGDGTV